MSQFKYLSPEWAKEATARLKQELTPEVMKFITSDMLTIYTNCPDGKDRALYYKFEKGEIVEVSVFEGRDHKAEFIITGDYETFAKISRAELGARPALMSGKLRLQGNMVKALSLSPIVDRLNKVLATIPTEF
jgi:putative sterol carrier protein